VVQCASCPTSLCASDQYEAQWICAAASATRATPNETTTRVDRLGPELVEGGFPGLPVPVPVARLSSARARTLAREGGARGIDTGLADVLPVLLLGLLLRAVPPSPPAFRVVVDFVAA
jgi:hypothetical protein